MMFAVKNANFGYTKEKRIIKDLSFSIDTGDLVSILGPNGAGKTTLLRCIMGFLPWNSGTVTLLGKDIQSYPATELWNIVSYVPQAKNNLSSLTCLEQILLGRASKLSLFSLPKAEDIAHAEKIMEELGILSLRDRKMNHLSGGEVQMVLIARALVSNPTLLILDEPESNLDFRNQIIVLDTLTQLAQQGMSIIFNTHYPDHALQRSNKSLLIDKQGRTTFGATCRIITEQSIARAFGVKSVIGEIETDHKSYINVLPLEVIRKDRRDEGKKTNWFDDDINWKERKEKETKQHRTLAIMSLILEKTDSAPQVNTILHRYSSLIQGRMGMRTDAHIQIINLTIEGEKEQIMEMSSALSQIKEISIKTTYAQHKGEYHEQ